MAMAYGPNIQSCSVCYWRNVCNVGVTLLLPFIEVIDSMQRRHFL